MMLGISLAIFISGLALNQLYIFRAKRAVLDWHKFAAVETARSGFVLMEAALSRRLYEMPPDSGKNACLKLTTFQVSGTTPEGILYKVKATYDTASSILNMQSQATKGSLTVTFQKQAKILDAGNYLAFSKGPQAATVGNYMTSEPTGILANTRRLYFEGPVYFQTGGYRGNMTSFSQPAPLDSLHDPAIILQADRISFLGGMSYSLVGSIPATILPGQPAYNLLYPKYVQPNMIWQEPPMAAYLGADYNAALTVYNSLSATPPVSPANPAQVAQQLYPKAFFGGSDPLPLNASTGVDTGDYLKPDRWVAMFLSYSSNGFGWQGDLSCYTDQSKLCSSPSDFPLGFIRWKGDAGLSNTLVTSGAPVDFPTLNWDNMQALEEDAAACGLVVSSPRSSGVSGSYEDCFIADVNTVTNYIANPGKNPCSTISTLDTENLNREFPSFNPASYLNPALSPLFLRRVIYVKTPLEIPQNAATGVARNLTAAVRQNMSLWIVGEAPLTLRPFQPDKTSPLNDPAGKAKMRDVYFNADPSGNLTPLKLVILSPDVVSVNTPFRVPLTYAELVTDYPVVKGKIKPRFGVNTDFKRQEKDGFLYGSRILHLENIDLITGNVATRYETGLFLRGLWSGVDSSAEQFEVGGCMLANPLSGTPQDIMSTAQPSYAGNFPPNNPPSGSNYPPIPPKTSVFYDPNTKQHMYAGRPWVFQVLGGGAASSVLLHGLRAIIPFDSTAPAGKRALTVPVNLWTGPLYSNYVDLSDRLYYAVGASFFKDTPPGGLACTDANSQYKDGSPAPIPLYVNEGFQQLSQQNPSASFVNLGAIGATLLPTVESGN